MANEYLKRIPTSTGNRKVFTWSAWIKRNKLGGGSDTALFASTSGDVFRIRFAGSDKIDFIYYNGTNYGYAGTQVLRDVGGWMHILMSVDSTDEIGDNRMMLFLNGVHYIGSKLGTQVPINTNFPTNSLITHWIGCDNGPNGYWNGELADVFFIDGQALTPDVFGFYKQGNGYISAGSTQATDFRPGQWVPKAPRIIKTEINRRGGFGVNGYYLPMNDSSNFGADFHTTPNSIITLKGEDLPQPRNGAPTTTDAYVSQLRTDPYAANLVLAVPGISGGQGSGYGDYSADIKGSGSNKTLTAVGNAGVAATASYYGSALSFDGSGDYFEIANNDDFDFGSGDFTIEFWQNANNFTANSGSGIWDNANNQRSWLIYNSTTGGRVRFYVSVDGTASVNINTTGPDIPTGEWVHFCMERNGSNLVGYVNGVCVGINTNLGTQSLFTPVDPLWIGSWSSNDLNGYIQDFRVYKGVAKYKGGFDVPKPYTPVGIATWRAVSDTTANNFATMSPLIEARPSSGSNTNHASSILTFADGNLSLTNDADSGKSQRQMAFSSVGFSTGKWYYEQITGSNGRLCLSKGIQQNIYGLEAGSGAGLEALVRINAFDGVISIASTAYYSTATPANLTAESFDTTNVMGVSVDASLGKNNLTVQFYKDGVGIATLTGIGATSPVEEWFPTKLPRSSGTADEAYFNFGQNPTFSGRVTAGTFTDSNGKGLFKYEPPSGFLALCEDNLPTPAIADPGEHFKTVLYTGDNSEGRSITGVGFKPDLIWFKARNSTASHVINDTVRGVTAHLNSNTTADESIPGFPYLNSVDSDGFSLRGGTSSGGNISGRDMVAWCWRAGAGTTTANTSGSIPSVVSVNQDAGFSIVSYTGDGNAGATFGHGLGKTPGFIIVKRRDSASQWNVWTSSLTNNQALYLNLTNDVQSSTTFWNDTDPNSSVITLGTDRNVLNGTYIAYCWTEIEGFSKFGSYVGNGNADGPFVYCGFKPAWLMIKNSNASSNWFVYDSVRDSYNMVGNFIRANINDEEGTFANIDFLSNGFKFRDAAANNSLDQRHIFAAFAESPFQTANAK